MADVVVRLHSFASNEDAVKTAEDIRQAGTMNYKSTEGGDVNVTVGDVTVEQA